MTNARLVVSLVMAAALTLAVASCSGEAPAEPGAQAEQEESAEVETEAPVEPPPAPAPAAVPAGWPAWIPLDGASEIKVVNEAPVEIALFVKFPSADAFHAVTAAIVAAGCTKNPYEYAEMNERVLDCVLGPEHIWFIGRNDFSAAELYYHPVYPLS